MRPAFSFNWRTAADAKSVHDHLSRHHAGSINERARFDISLGMGTYAPVGIAAGLPSWLPSELATGLAGELAAGLAAGNEQSPS
jgi:hypothetical protein